MTESKEYYDAVFFTIAFALCCVAYWDSKQVLWAMLAGLCMGCWVFGAVMTIGDDE